MATWRTSEGETADLICHRAFGRTGDVTEALLEANPGLADLGPILPAGLVVELPEPPIEETPRPLRLWD